jgi:hypothetical protein
MIAGKRFPGSTRVGINMQVVQHDKRIFGQDSREFVPEWWLRCSEKESVYMERHLRNFRYGSRICVAKQ